MSKELTAKKSESFPFEAIASERQFFLTNCTMAHKRISSVASIFSGEDEAVYHAAKNLAEKIIALYDIIDAWYMEHPQKNYKDMEGSDGKTADLTRLYTFCSSLSSFGDYYRETCPEVSQHCWLAMASIIDAANAIAAFHGRKGEPQGMDTLGAYLGFSAFLSDPEVLRGMVSEQIQKSLEKE